MVVTMRRLVIRRLLRAHAITLRRAIHTPAPCRHYTDAHAAFSRHVTPLKTSSLHTPARNARHGYA